MRGRKRRRKRIIQIVVILISLVLLVIVAGLSYMDANPMIVKAVTIEAGTPSVDQSYY